MIYIKNIGEVQTIYIPRNELLSETYVVTNKNCENCYNEGLNDGIGKQKDKLTVLSVSENGLYKREDGWHTVDINIKCKADNKQEKNITITQEFETVLPDEGYDSLSKVDINASEYGNQKHLEGYNEGYKAGNASNIVNVKELGIKLGYSSFTEVPNCFVFEGLEDTSYMFANSINLKTIPQFDTSKVTDMQYMFARCDNLRLIPMLDTTNVTNMSGMFMYAIEIEDIPQLNTSKVISMDFMFYGRYSLKTIPPLDTSRVQDMKNMFCDCINLISIPPLDTSRVKEVKNMFQNCDRLVSVPPLNLENATDLNTIFGIDNKLESLTDFGGFIGVKSNLYLTLLPNLSYQSCINVLNNLYDFTGNGMQPTVNEGRLKVHQNFLDLVGDNISIGTNRGWIITA